MSATLPTGTGSCSAVTSPAARSSPSGSTPTTVLAGMHCSLWEAIEHLKALVGLPVDIDVLANPDVALADLAGRV